MNNFIYDNSTKIYFGPDQLHNLGIELSRYGKKVLLCYGGGSIKKSGLYDKVSKEIQDNDLELFELSGIEPNPRVTSVNEGGDICKKENIDVILAVGGGSVIDCAKFISAAAFYDGDAWDISKGKVQVTKCIPIITILTLSATGSEMNSGGVISNLETNEKIGNGFKPMLPKVSFLDPTLTYTVSEYQTACGAVDIMSHIFESYFCKEKDLFMLDKMMESLLQTVVKYAPIALNNPESYEARANIMWASTWAINGFIRGAKRTNWICHMVEHQLSAYYDITHGLGLAIVTPRWLRYILDSNTSNRIYELGINIFNVDNNLDKEEGALKTIELLEDFFFNTLKLESKLSNLNITEENFEQMASNIKNADQDFVFKPLSKTDIVNILKACL